MTELNKRDLETLIAETEKDRTRMQKALEKIKNLDAAIESDKEAHKKVNSRHPAGKVKQ